MYNIEAHRICIIMSKTISTATRYLIQKHWLLCICIFNIVDSSLIKLYIKYVPTLIDLSKPKYKLYYNSDNSKNQCNTLNHFR
jgi:hypothetical protein